MLRASTNWLQSRTPPWVTGSFNVIRYEPTGVKLLLSARVPAAVAAAPSAAVSSRQQWPLPVEQIADSEVPLSQFSLTDCGVV